MFYIWNKPGFKNLKRKRLARALQRGATIFNGAPLSELKGLDNYAYVEDLRARGLPPFSPSTYTQYIKAIAERRSENYRKVIRAVQERIEWGEEDDKKD